MEPTGKKQKRLKLSTFGIICGILHLEYLKMRVKKVKMFHDIELENFNSIETIFFSIYKNLIFHLCPNLTRFLKKIYLGGLYTKKNSIRTRISRWLGRENEENVAQTRNCCGNLSFPHWTNIQCNQRTTQRNKESH